MEPTVRAENVWTHLPPVVVVMLYFVLCPAPVHAATQKTDDLIRAGQKLEAKEATELEEHLTQNATDLESRTKLLGYYFNRSFDSPEAKAAKERHILWIIENRPDADVAGNAVSLVLPYSGGEAFKKAQALWIAKVDGNPNDLKIVGNAAKFFWEVPGTRGESLLQRAADLDPENPAWEDKLLSLYHVRFLGCTGEEAKVVAKKGLATVEELLRRAEARPEARPFALIRCCSNMTDFAIALGDTQNAKARLVELLAAATAAPDEKWSPFAVHYSHTALGRIALSESKSDDAAQHLIDAVTIKAQKPMQFKPETSLASELLRKGKRDVVLKYLETCLKLWPADDTRLSKWIEIVGAGGEPDWKLRAPGNGSR